MLCESKSNSVFVLANNSFLRQGFKEWEHLTNTQSKIRSSMKWFWPQPNITAFYEKNHHLIVVNFLVSSLHINSIFSYSNPTSWYSKLSLLLLANEMKYVKITVDYGLIFLEVILFWLELCIWSLIKRRGFRL